MTLPNFLESKGCRRSTCVYNAQLHLEAGMMAAAYKQENVQA